MPNKKFFEEHPLYTLFEFDFSDFNNVDQLPQPSLHMRCPTCDADQTFTMENSYSKALGGNNYVLPEDREFSFIMKLIYRCASCKYYERIFFVRIGQTLKKILKKDDPEDEDDTEKQKGFLQKLGQWPSLEEKIDKNIVKMLNDSDKDCLGKGMRCESQGYGIGAYAYYRRIVDNIINKLLGELPKLMSGEEKKKYNDAFDLIKKSTITRDKINLVKDLLPESLKINGSNPLGLLYEALSDGIHEKTEDECMELAVSIRSIMIYLISQVRRHEEAEKEFTDAMKNVLIKKGRSQKLILPKKDLTEQIKVSD